MEGEQEPRAPQAADAGQQRTDPVPLLNSGWLPENATSYKFRLAGHMREGFDTATGVSLNLLVEGVSKVRASLTSNLYFTQDKCANNEPSS